jgi:hypothetical protein
VLGGELLAERAEPMSRVAAHPGDATGGAQTGG